MSRCNNPLASDDSATAEVRARIGSPNWHLPRNATRSRFKSCNIYQWLEDLIRKWLKWSWHDWQWHDWKVRSCSYLPDQFSFHYRHLRSPPLPTILQTWILQTETSERRVMDRYGWEPLAPSAFHIQKLRWLKTEMWRNLNKTKKCSLFYFLPGFSHITGFKQFRLHTRIFAQRYVTICPVYIRIASKAPRLRVVIRISAMIVVS